MGITDSESDDTHKNISFDYSLYWPCIIFINEKCPALSLSK